MVANSPQNYVLSQRGRSRVDFLIELGLLARELEMQADTHARDVGLNTRSSTADPEQLGKHIAPVMYALPDFRLFRLVREWQLAQHGRIATEAFDEIRGDLEAGLQALQDGETSIRYAKNPAPPAYWDGYEFHRSTGGWDGHDYMGFVHGEIIHRRMVGDTFAGIIMRQRSDAALAAPVNNPNNILELGCGSGQYTMSLATTYPEAELWACDLSRKQLEQAQRRANYHGHRWHLFEAAAEDTQLEAGYFDLVTSYAMFHELPVTAILATMQEAFRLLKPGGSFFIADVTPYHVQDDYSCWKADLLNYVQGGDPYWREYAQCNLAGLAEEAGLLNVDWSAANEQQYPFYLRANKPTALNS
jgi:SAM-dependent methyltransferase